jgi:hypothetical protein
MPKIGDGKLWVSDADRVVQSAPARWAPTSSERWRMPRSSADGRRLLAPIRRASTAVGRLQRSDALDAWFVDALRRHRSRRTPGARRYGRGLQLPARHRRAAHTTTWMLACWPS